MKVLYLHSVPQFGGASRSLYELVRSLRSHGVEPFIVASKGSTERFFSEVSIDSIYPRRLSAFNNTKTGHYRSFRWLVLIREILSLPGTIFSLAAAVKRFGPVSLIHANELIDLPSAIIARYFFKSPIIVHLRTSFRGEERSLRSQIILWALKKYNVYIIAIDENTKTTLPTNCPTTVVHNSFRVECRPEYLDRRRGDFSDWPLTVGYVGNLLHSKGIIELLKALKMLRDQGMSVRLVVAGGAILKRKSIRSAVFSALRISDDASSEAALLIKLNEMGDYVEMLGHVDDISRIYSSIDLLVFPSVFDSPGRPIFEAGLHGKPTIACLTKPLEDTFIHGETGIAISSNQPIKICEAIERFYDDPREIERMGRNAYTLAKSNFDPEANAKKVFDIYEMVSKKNSGLSLFDNS